MFNKSHRLLIRCSSPGYEIRRARQERAQSAYPRGSNENSPDRTEGQNTVLNKDMLIDVKEVNQDKPTNEDSIILKQKA